METKRDEVVKVLENEYQGDLSDTQYLGESEGEQCNKDGALLHIFTGCRNGQEYRVRACFVCGRIKMWNPKLIEAAKYFEL